ncbi:dual specificity protein phosphatase family protein [Chondromyces crocatus]|uniref:Protein-tyrosine phosphatase n=1 Tax=Chondromyces crocatus TaxID=52 RepID=A0A0K1EMW9_CHOCO|nr:dual specificity protein phosphatase family protein [Chondromyces crocatus]AKT42002.1 protein-tyrosine phosphatase [Chondromyces crocatus]
MDELERFSYLIPDELAGMGYPEGPEALAHLRAIGVRSLVSLSRRAPDVGGLGHLVHLRCPMTDYDRIPVQDLHRAVVFIDRAPRPVAVHGETGLGRTGVVLACRLVSLGHTAEAAIDAVRRARPGSIDDPELSASVVAYQDFLTRAPWRTPYNFASASPLDAIVHGAERPGHGDTTLSRSEVDAWLGFMSRQGMREVLCLLDQAYLGSHHEVLGLYRREFLRATEIPLEDGASPTPRELDAALEVLRRAEASGSPIVVHCGDGAGRTGLVLAAWLRYRHGLRPDQAIDAVQRHARHLGAFRNPLEFGPQALTLLAGLRTS